MRINSAFHISLLEQYSDNPLPSQRKEPPPSIETEGEPEYELDEIVDSRLCRRNQLQNELSGHNTLPNTIKFGIQKATSKMPASQSNDFIKVILTNQDRVTNITNENLSTLPTQEEVRKNEAEWKTSIKTARKKENYHGVCPGQLATTTSALCTWETKMSRGGSLNKPENNHQPHHTRISLEGNATIGVVPSPMTNQERVRG